MMNHLFKKFIAVYWVILFAAVAGCSTLPVSQDMGVNNGSQLPDFSVQEIKSELADQQGWWYVRFKKAWPKGEPPPFYYDPLLADQVVAPTLNAHRADIKLWRFHRRANNDGAGCQFSFIFYTSVKNASQVYDEISKNPVVLKLLKAGLIEKVGFDDLGVVALPKVEGTSDHGWPIEIQQTWPYFIMGASESWLAQGTIFYKAKQTAGDNLEITKLAETYKEISNIIDFGWMSYGKHAYLHHLNALFGYVPLQVDF